MGSATEAETSEGTVSVIIPVYNGEETLRFCLESVLAQDYPGLEIIVVDDASSDASATLAETLIAGDERATLVAHPTNQGLAATLNHGVNASKGDLLLFLQQDCELQGQDWLSRATRRLRHRPFLCLSGRPTFPLAELSTVELAFGMIRDQFPLATAEDEELGFSEFKCDLVPRAALPSEAPFDTRFRISGEDQVLSQALRERGWTILRPSDLTYLQRFGGQTRVVRNLQKDVANGTTQAGILLASGMRVLPASSRVGQTRRKLGNRLSAVLNVGAILLTVAVVLLPLSPLLIALPLSITSARIASVAMRQHALRPLPPRRRLAGVGAVLPLTLASDLVYGASFLAGLGIYFTTIRS